MKIFYNLEAWPRGYKTFFMLNSAEHELCPAMCNRSQNPCKLLTIAGFILLNIADFEGFSANTYENVNYSYLLAENISCSAEFSIRKCLCEEWIHIQGKASKKKKKKKKNV